MTNKEENNKANAKANVKKEENADYQINNARVIKVWQSGYDKNRISIQLDKTFKSFNEKGELVEDADTFGISTNALLQQCNTVDYLALIDAMSMGKSVNPQIIALIMNKAIISVDRVFKHAGEEREFEKGVYGSDCFTSKITSIKTNIAPVFEKQINKLIETALIVKDEAVANPWD